MPHNAASDQGLHCLHMSHKKDARLISVKCLQVSSGARNMPNFWLKLHSLLYIQYQSGKVLVRLHRYAGSTVLTVCL